MVAKVARRSGTIDRLGAHFFGRPLAFCASGLVEEKRWRRRTTLEGQSQKRPPAVILENVPHLLRIDRGETIATMCCHLSELLGPTSNRVSFDNEQLIITATKGKRDRIQPIPFDVVTMLRELQTNTLADGASTS